jgi:hypothetical protein
MMTDAFEDTGRTPEQPAGGDVPAAIDVLPDGRTALIVGDIEGCREFNHPQGDNPFGFRGTCGLVSCEDVLRQFGFDVTEADVVRYAAENGLCNVTGDASQCGGTTFADQAQVLTDFGVPAHVKFAESSEDLAHWVESGHGVIIGVNAGILWDDAAAYDSGQANHAIVVTGLARDSTSGELLGFFVNDSGRGYSDDSGRFIETSLMDAACIDTGGGCVVSHERRDFDAP